MPLVFADDEYVECNNSPEVIEKGYNKKLESPGYPENGFSKGSKCRWRFNVRYNTTLTCSEIRVLCRDDANLSIFVRRKQHKELCKIVTLYDEEIPLPSFQRQFFLEIILNAGNSANTKLSCTIQAGKKTKRGHFGSGLRLKRKTFAKICRKRKTQHGTLHIWWTSL